jgi:hypothetical protein
MGGYGKVRAPKRPDAPDWVKLSPISWRPPPIRVDRVLVSPVRSAFSLPNILHLRARRSVLQVGALVAARHRARRSPQCPHPPRERSVLGGTPRIGGRTEDAAEPHRDWNPGRGNTNQTTRSHPTADEGGTRGVCRGGKPERVVSSGADLRDFGTQRAVAQDLSRNLLARA